MGFKNVYCNIVTKLDMSKHTTEVLTHQLLHLDKPLLTLEMDKTTMQGEKMKTKANIANLSKC